MWQAVETSIQSVTETRRIATSAKQAQLLSKYRSISNRFGKENSMIWLN